MRFVAALKVPILYTRACAQLRTMNRELHPNQRLSYSWSSYFSMRIVQAPTRRRQFLRLQGRHKAHDRLSQARRSHFTARDS